MFQSIMLLLGKTKDIRDSKELFFSYQRIILPRTLTLDIRRPNAGDTACSVKGILNQKKGSASQILQLLHT